MGLYIIINLCHKLKYLNICHHIEFSKILICNIIHFCLKFQHLNLNFYKITNITIKKIASLYFNLKYLNLKEYIYISKKAVDQLNPNIHIENFINNIISSNFNNINANYLS